MYCWCFVNAAYVSFAFLSMLLSCKYLDDCHAMNLQVTYLVLHNLYHHSLCPFCAPSQLWFSVCAYQFMTSFHLPKFSHKALHTYNYVTLLSFFNFFKYIMQLLFACFYMDPIRAQAFAWCFPLWPVMPPPSAQSHTIKDERPVYAALQDIGHVHLVWHCSFSMYLLHIIVHR